MVVYEQTKLLIAIWCCLLFSEAILGSLLASSMVMIILAATRYGAILSHTARSPCLLYLNFCRFEQNHI